MNLLYGEDKYFIGAVKFFDVKKNFGYLASNNCNMPTSEYEQDFYVDSASFIEDDAKEGGSIVVFQVELQKDGKTRAVNVRCITKSDEDVHLALSYYGDHEYILFKDDKRINLYNEIKIPVRLEAEKVQSIIVNDGKRSPEITANHFKFFIEHYKQDRYSKDRYIFDCHFSKEAKSIWISFFSVLTDDERLEILKLYPSTCRYFDDTTLLNKWLNIYFNDSLSLEQIELLRNNLDFLPEECVSMAKERIQIIVDEKVRNLYLEISQKDDINESDLDLNPANFRTGLIIYHSNSDTLIWKLKEYLRISENKYIEEKKACLRSVRYNKFKASLNNFVARGADQRSSKDLRDSYNVIEEDKDKCLLELEKRSKKLIDKDIEKENYEHAISVLIFVSQFDANFVLTYSEKLYVPIHNILHNKLVNSISNSSTLKNTFFDCFNSWTSIYDNRVKDCLKDEFGSIMLQKASVSCLSVCSDAESGWLPIDKVLNRVTEIISDWEYNDFAAFINNSEKLFDEHISYNDLIVSKALSLICNIPVSKAFSRNGYVTSDDIIIQEQNSSFLNEVKTYVKNSSSNIKELWNNYINTRNQEELIILYNNGVISDLPDNMISNIINHISLNDVLAESNRWYYKPELGNLNYKKILSKTQVDLFPIILARLASIQLDEETTPLAVLLTELMTINRPSDDDINESRDWDVNFTLKLKNAMNSLSSNIKLVFILWAVHLRHKTSLSGLKETFTLLPPYLQIKVLKKLFQYIAQGMLCKTAEELYNLIVLENKKLCLPLEITFAYLMRREKDSSATLDDNIMLGLLDGRDDYPEWIGIRQLITECHGRWQARELPDDRSNSRRGSFFNGIIKIGRDNKLIVYVPCRMVDENENIKNYNNKYFTNIQDLIRISYDNRSEYQRETVQNGVIYTFNASCKIDLFSLARAYNLKYERFDNYVGFENKEDEDCVFCECRASDALDNRYGISFYWCENKKCFRQPIRYMLDSEWEKYTILDFMRILHIPTDYTNKEGKVTKYGYYIILSAYLRGFADFYKHLMCRECGKLMKPLHISNFAFRAVTQFQCTDERCKGYGKIVYLNHCFNKRKCKATIDSRDSKQCPNGQYICPECGACCSTENFRLRINHLQTNGRNISNRLKEFVKNNLGHWEKHEFYCYKCGKPMVLQPSEYVCMDCITSYKRMNVL